MSRRSRLAVLFALVAASILFVSLVPPQSRPLAGQAPASRRRSSASIAPALISQDSETWAFDPPTDSFARESRLDLRGLNEAVAGESGFVKLSTDGDSFTLGDGSPVRFWAINSFAAHLKNPKALAYHARFLAKRGVNMVRLHTFINSNDPDARLEDVDEKAIDEVWRLVAAMKTEGIYVTISPYWANHVKAVPKGWELEGWPSEKPPNGLLFFNERLQRGYRAWLKALLSRPNPYTGIPLAQDPAVAILQLQNEDSMLFFTMSQVVGKQAEVLGTQFGDWLTRRYGSIGAASKAWGGEKTPGDDLGRGVVAPLPVWRYNQPASRGLNARLNDQLRFYGETMRDFNAETVRYLREDLGCRHLINAGNWRTANPIRLNDVERWSYTAADVIGVNHYYSTVHLGPTRGFRIQGGDRFVDESALLHPRELPFLVRQVEGHPTIVPEGAWVAPLSYISEGPFLVSAYQSLSGLDAFYWFAIHEEGWATLAKPIGINAAVGKWKAGSPMTLGQFPAAALSFRRGFVARGAPAVSESRPLQDLWDRRAPLIAEDSGYDPNRDLGDAAVPADLPGGVDPLAFLVGPVQVAYGGEKPSSKVIALDQYIDPKAQVVTSDTRQIRLDHGRGVCTLDAPKAQGACGFLSTASPLELSTITIRSEDDYASILVVPLDGEPLAESAWVLVQVGTVARPTGRAESSATFSAKQGGENVTYRGSKVDEVGTMPWRIRKAADVLTVRNPTLRKAVALDPNGMPGHAVPLKDVPGGVEFTIPPDTLYMLLTP